MPIVDLFCCIGLSTTFEIFERLRDEQGISIGGESPPWIEVLLSPEALGIALSFCSWYEAPPLMEKFTSCGELGV
jgi:hypothetical protein